MASLRNIRRRIRPVRSIQKITAAMKMVAASKLRKAQEAIQQARPYAIELASLLHRVAALAADAHGEVPHPLLDLREPKRVLLVVITSDRGLCGAFNTNIVRRTEAFVAKSADLYEKIELATIGRRGRDYFKRHATVSVRDFPGVFDNLTFRRATEIAQGLAEEFVRRELDAVFLLYNEFKSAMTQRVTVKTLLPIDHEQLPIGADIDYLYEPSQREVLDSLVPRYVATEVWRSLLESAASEHGARMTAMGGATRNASDLADRLTLQYNRARQAAITGELMDIVGGANALKG